MTFNKVGKKICIYYPHLIINNQLKKNIAVTENVDLKLITTISFNHGTLHCKKIAE